MSGCALGLSCHGMPAPTEHELVERARLVARILELNPTASSEFLGAFEADELVRIVDTMRAARAVEARLHVREETPFFTGPRVELLEWADRQPTA